MLRIKEPFLFFQNLLKGCKDILFPKTCFVCKNKLSLNNIDEVICLDCWRKIKKHRPPFCHQCGRQLHKQNIYKSICPKCAKRNLYFDRALSPCLYDGAVKELIHQFKYQNKEYLGATLSRLLIDFIKEYNFAIDFVDYIIPVPLHQSKLREREYNQAEILSNYISKAFNKPLEQQNLIRCRQTESQAGLQPEKRIENIKNSFKVKSQELLKNKNILLIDDVLTTGATASEASYALKKSGANIVFVLTLAS